MVLSMLPLELWRTILESHVHDVGLKHAVQLRLINKFFNSETLRAIAVTHAFGASALDVYRRRPEGILFTACYVAQRPHAIQRHNPNRLSAFINTILDELATADAGFEALSRDENARFQSIKTLCEKCRNIQDFHTKTPAPSPFHAQPETATSSPTKDDVLLAAILLNRLSYIETATRALPLNTTHSAAFGKPLHAAASAQNPEIVRLLIARNVNVNLLDRGDLALRAAVLANDLATANALLHAPTGHCGAGIAFESCIREAFDRRHLQLGWRLIDHAQGQDVQRALTQCLRRSSLNGWTATAEALLARGANVDGLPGRFSTPPSPLELAAFAGQDDVLRLLLRRGARLEGGYSRFGPIAAVVYGDQAGAARLLLDAGVRLPRKDWLEVLQSAERHNAGKVIRLLVQRGIVDLAALSDDADENDLYRASLVASACGFGDVELVRFYVACGLPVHGASCQELLGAQPVVFALAYGQLHMVEALLKLGVGLVDPRTSCFAEGFRDGSYPCCPPKMELPKAYVFL